MRTKDAILLGRIISAYVFRRHIIAFLYLNSTDLNTMSCYRDRSDGMGEPSSFRILTKKFKPYSLEDKMQNRVENSKVEMPMFMQKRDFSHH